MMKILITEIFCCTLLAVSLLLTGCRHVYDHEIPKHGIGESVTKAESWPSEPTVTESRTYSCSFAYFYEILHQGGIKIEDGVLTKTGENSARISLKDKVLPTSSATSSIFVPAKDKYGFEICDGRCNIYRGRGGDSLDLYVKGSYNVESRLYCHHKYDIDIYIEGNNSRTTVTFKSEYKGPVYGGDDTRGVKNSETWQRFVKVSKKCDYAEFVQSIFSMISKIV